jgi:hypothetical protein
MQGMSQAIRAGLDLGAPFANMPDTTITSASGQKITTSTGRDAQIAMAQQMTGIPRQIIERYMRNPELLTGWWRSSDDGRPDAGSGAGYDASRASGQSV